MNSLADVKLLILCTDRRLLSVSVRVEEVLGCLKLVVWLILLMQSVDLETPRVKTTCSVKQSSW